MESVSRSVRISKIVIDLGFLQVKKTRRDALSRDPINLPDVVRSALRQLSMTADRTTSARLHCATSIGGRAAGVLARRHMSCPQQISLPMGNSRARITGFLQVLVLTSPIVDISTLPVAQLSQVKRQLDEEVQHLTQSYSSLRAAQLKFKDCIETIKNGISTKDDTTKELLVPLTTSLYVPGTLADSENVLVDVGTGFYIEKSVQDATTFYQGKVTDLGKNIKDLEGIVEGKANSLRVVEEVLRQKMLAQQSGATEDGKGSSKS